MRGSHVCVVWPFDADAPGVTPDDVDDQDCLCEEEVSVEKLETSVRNLGGLGGSDSDSDSC